MEFKDLKPETKLFYTIFGEGGGNDVKDLPPEGCQAVRDVLKHMEEEHGRQRSVHVLRLRCGLLPRTNEEKERRPGGSDVRSLKEVAPYLGVTRERIRQIEVKCLRQLRHPSHLGKLKPWL